MRQLASQRPPRELPAPGAAGEALSSCGALGGVSWGRDRVSLRRAPGDSAFEAPAREHTLLRAAQPPARSSRLSGSPGSTTEPAALTRLLGTVPDSHVLPSDPGESGPSLRTPPRSLENKAEGSPREA